MVCRLKYLATLYNISAGGIALRASDTVCDLSLSLKINMIFYGKKNEIITIKRLVIEIL